MSDGKQVPVRWFYRPVWVVVAILAAGPFALPLVWLSPGLKRWHKVLLSLITIVITIWLVKATAEIYQALVKEMAELQGMM